jgi:uncharacterized protein (TIGR02284 family)
MPTAITTEIRDVLNKLIEACLDGEQGFEAAAEAVTEASLKTELMQYSRQRLEFAGDLQRLLASIGEEPAHHGSMAGKMHRGWMNLKQTVSGGNPHAVLVECERGEDSAVQAYQKALDEPLPQPISELIESQYRDVLLAHDRIKALRDASKA